MITDEDVAEFLEHHGIPGMKWGVRRERRAEKFRRRTQKAIDRTHRVATGKASAIDRIGAFNRTLVVTKKGANRQLQRGANQQAKVKAKIDAGKIRVRKKNAPYFKVLTKDLKYYKTGDAKAKMDGGQKLAVAALATWGTVTLATVIANR